MRNHRTTIVASAVAAVAAVVCAVGAATAVAAETVVQDDAHLLYRSESEVRAVLEDIRALGVDRVRLTAGWSLIAPSPDSSRRPDFNAADPAAYPAANWVYLDRAVRLAHQLGLKVMIDIAFWAPRWATHDDPATPNRLRTEIDPDQYALFASAVARRYNGSFTPPLDPGPPPPPAPDSTLLDQLFGGTLGSPPPPPAPSPPKPLEPLPAVSMYTLWNEPNLQVFLLPQWERRGAGWFPRSAEIYRAMVQAAYPAIKSQAPNAQVLIGGTAGTASRVPGIGSVPPLRFIRALACVDQRLRPITTGGCAAFRQVPGDGWAHHPYSTKTLPSRDASDPNNVPVAGTPRLVATLRALVRRGRLAAGNADVYMTEYGYETNPPDPHATFGLEQQGALLAQAEYIATRSPAVKMWAQFMLRDLPGDALGSDWQSGLYFADGRPKPAASTFRTPSFATCVRSGRQRLVMVWARVRGAESPANVTLEAKQAGAAWQSQASWTSARAASVAQAATTLALAPGVAAVRYLRRQSGTAYRVRWTGRDGIARAGPEVVPAPCPASSRRPHAREHARRVRDRAPSKRNKTAKGGPSRARRARAPGRARAARSPASPRPGSPGYRP
jgi:hypothetical protein